jgi:hypothetical protein
MPTAQTQQVSGTLTSTGSQFNLPLGFIPSRFEYYNRTQANNATATQAVKKANWNANLPNGTSYVIRNTVSAATDESSLLATGGFSIYDGSLSVKLNAPITGTAISLAASAVVTMLAHGFTTGDVVLLSNTTGMPQVGGQYYTVTVLSASTFSIPVNSTGFAAAATNVVARKVAVGPLFVPQQRGITGITQASQAVVTTSTNHGLTAGQVVRILVPSRFGMTQINRVQAKILSVTANTMTLDVNSSSFTAFAYPIVAQYPVNFPQVVPMGSGPIGSPAQDLLDDATDNIGYQGITFGSAVSGALNDVIDWVAFRDDSVV